MIVGNVISHFKWSPDVIQKMYLDDDDEWGLFFHHATIERQEKELKKLKANIKK